MKFRTCGLPVIAGTALLALVASEPAAHAQRVTFGYTGSLVTYTVPAIGLYQITAYGAQGGSGSFGLVVGSGGLGAEIGGDFTLTAGETLQIAVGGAGSPGNNNGGGGGGGSFVVGPGNAPLVIAGGGGGGAGDEPLSGGGGLVGQNGGIGTIVNGVPNGGINGNGGGALEELPGGGGGGGASLPRSLSYWSENCC